jgi:hypothetical protein
MRRARIGNENLKSLLFLNVISYAIINIGQTFKIISSGIFQVPSLNFIYQQPDSITALYFGERNIERFKTTDHAFGEK